MTRRRTPEEMELEKLLGPPAKGGAVTGPRADPEAPDPGSLGEAEEIGMPSQQFIDPKHARMGVGIGAGLLTAPLSPALSIPIGVVAGEAAGQLQELVNRRAGATARHLIGPEELDLRVLNATFNMLKDGVGGIVGSGIGKGAARLLSGKGAGKRMSEFEGTGVKPTAGDVSQNRFFQGIEFLDSRLLTSQKAMREFRQAQVDALQRNFTETVENASIQRNIYGPAKIIKGGAAQRTPSEVGQQTLDRLTSKPSDSAYETSYFKGFRETNARARDGMNAAIDKRAVVDPSETTRFWNENRALYESPEMRAFLMPKVESGGQGFMAALQAESKTKGGLTWEKFDRLHQNIGSRLDNSFGLPGEQAAALDALYKVMREDMRRTAKAMGGVADEAWNKYDAFYTSAKAIEKNLVSIIQSNDPEKIFRAADSTKRLQALQTALTPGQFNDFRAAKIFDLGKWNPDLPHDAGQTFKISTWARNYTALGERSPEFTDLLYGLKSTAMRDSADRLARVSTYLKDAEAVANRSGTAYMNIIGELLGGQTPAIALAAYGHPGFAAASGGAALVMPWATGHLMRSPRFVRWLADAETIKARDFAGLFTHVGRLAAMQFGDEQLDKAARTIHDMIRPEIQRQQSLMKDTRAGPANAKAGQVADTNKQILKISDYADKVRADQKLSESDRKKRLEPLENQMRLMQSRRDAMVKG